MARKEGKFERSRFCRNRAHGFGFHNGESSKSWGGLAWKKAFRLCQNGREV